MTLRTLKYGAAVAGLAGALSLAGVTASSAGPHWGGHWHGGWGPGAAIGAGVAGFALGAAAAANSQYYGYGPSYGYGSGYYDYAPGAVAVDPGPTYYNYYDDGPWRGRKVCGKGISGC